MRLILNTILITVATLMLSSCNDIDISTYEEAIEVVIEKSDSIEVALGLVEMPYYDIEMFHDNNSGNFYTIIDNFKENITDVKIVSVPIASNEQVGDVPQIGYFEEVNLGPNDKGIILSGSVDNVEYFDVVTRVSFTYNNEKYVEYIKLHKNE